MYTLLLIVIVIVIATVYYLQNKQPPVKEQTAGTHAAIDHARNNHDPVHRGSGKAVGHFTGVFTDSDGSVKLGSANSADTISSEWIGVSLDTDTNMYHFQAKFLVDTDDTDNHDFVLSDMVPSVLFNWPDVPDGVTYDLQSKTVTILWLIAKPEGDVIDLQNNFLSSCTLTMVEKLTHIRLKKTSDGFGIYGPDSGAHRWKDFAFAESVTAGICQKYFHPDTDGDEISPNDGKLYDYKHVYQIGQTDTHDITDVEAASMPGILCLNWIDWRKNKPKLFSVNTVTGAETQLTWNEKHVLVMKGPVKTVLPVWSEQKCPGYYPKIGDCTKPLEYYYEDGSIEGIGPKVHQDFGRVGSVALCQYEDGEMPSAWPSTGWCGNLTRTKNKSKCVQGQLAWLCSIDTWPTSSTYLEFRM